MNPTLTRRSRLQIEINASYPLDTRNAAVAQHVEAYLFAPRVLGINAQTYPKYLFYRDLHSYLELLPIARTLSEVLKPGTGLLHRLKRSAESVWEDESPAAAAGFESENRAFCHIVGIAFENILDQCKRPPGDGTCPDAVSGYQRQVEQLLREYRAIGNGPDGAPASPRLANALRLGDEHLSLMVEDICCRLAAVLQRESSQGGECSIEGVAALARSELAYRRARKYDSLPSRKGRNESLVYRRSGLREYAESVFLLSNRNKPEGRLFRELLLSLAAGVAMVVATAAAFAAHVRYENWTSTFFLVLVISYMFKDRIKALTQDFLTSRGERFFYDFRTTVRGQTSTWNLGVIRESVGFVPRERLHAEISGVRQRDASAALENAFSADQALLYKRKGTLYPARLAKAFRGFEIEAVRQVFHFDLTRFTRKMEDSKTEVFVAAGKTFRKEIGRRVYHLNLLIRIRTGRQVDLQRFRIVMTRRGILRIDRLPGEAPNSVSE